MKRTQLRRERGVRRWLAFCCALLLLTPPLLHWTTARFQSRSDAPSADGEGETVEERGWRHRAEGLEEQLRRAHDELAVLRSAPSGERYSTVLADPLRLADPSPGRSALWVVPRQPIESGYGGCAHANGQLMGRLRPQSVIDASAGTVQIQTVLDVGFRVRFRCATDDGAIHGMLSGTGRRDAQGRPLLRVEHLSLVGDLPSNRWLMTAGGDGVYPPGLRIGKVSSSAAFGETSSGLRKLARPSESDGEHHPQRVAVPVDFDAPETFLLTVDLVARRMVRMMDADPLSLETLR